MVPCEPEARSLVTHCGGCSFRVRHATCLLLLLRMEGCEEVVVHPAWNLKLALVPVGGAQSFAEAKRSERHLEEARVYQTPQTSALWSKPGPTLP